MKDTSLLHIETTADGSHTLFVPELDEHYHSVNGAIQESRHVFIAAGFNYIEKDSINILEIGFGTGLNAFLTLLKNKLSDRIIYYTGLELHPLCSSIIDKLNYTDSFSDEDKAFYSQLHKSEWEKRITISPQFCLTKICVDFSKLNIEFDAGFDLIYFDAFAPDKQSEMWTQPIFDFLYKHTSQGGVLTTYCAKGMVRRMLQQAGYTVERLAGPPGKREMLRAAKL